MSGPRARYLSRRGAVYQIRIPVPKQLHTHFGCKEIRRSLHTKDYLAAKRRISPAVLAFQNLCIKLIHMLDASVIPTRGLVSEFYQQLDKACAPFAAIPPSQIDQYHDQQQGHAEDARSELALELQSRSFSEESKDYAKLILAEHGLSLDQIGPRQRAELLEGIVRARIEQTYLTRHRQNSMLDPYEPRDDLFKESARMQLIAQERTTNSSSKKEDSHANPHPSQLVQSIAFQRPSEVHSNAQGATEEMWVDTTKNVTGRIDQYLTTESMEEKTRNEKRVVLNWFADFVGGNTPVTQITNDQMLGFRTLLINLRKHTPACADLKNSQTTVPQERVSAKTAKKKFDTVKRFMIWLEESGFIPCLPYKKLAVAVPAQAKSLRRRPFNASELETLFSSPIYTGSKSLKRRNEPGETVHRDDQFWLPLLLHYTGMRVAELILLPAMSVVLDSASPHINLDPSKQKLKSRAAERLIPIHPDLLDFGFGKFVKAQQKRAKNGPLFSTLASGSRPQDRYSKHFGRWLDKLELTDRRLVAHSFRHGFVDALRNASVDQSQIQQIIGHETNSVTWNYGRGTDLDVLYESVASADFGLSTQRKLALKNS